MAFSVDQVNVTKDRILLRRIDTENDKTPGGIVMPDNAIPLGNAAEVVTVGPGTDEDPITLTPGERVLISAYSGVEMVAGDETFVVVREQDVLARVA